MEDTSEYRIDPKKRKHVSIGLLAHVDAGKTTLSEAMLYTAGIIRKPGRVDNQDAYLDTYALERARGITIFSKQAVMKFKGMEVTLLDTPGHVDFSAEMERTLQVLDYAVLVISGADGVQGHTQTLWRLLDKYKVPVFLFINKMDQPGTDREWLMSELKSRLSENCVDFSEENPELFFDSVAMCDESAMEEFLENEEISDGAIAEMIGSRKLFPCFFGSALKLTGIEPFMNSWTKYMRSPVYGDDFGAKVFKISRDENGNRLTHMKITGGSLKVKSVIASGSRGDEKGEAGEKINQIRIYSGSRFETVNEAGAGTICAVTGLLSTRPGQGIGSEENSGTPMLRPVLTYGIDLPEGCEPAVILPKLRELEEEIPEMHIVWNEQLFQIQVQLMGEVQTEILRSLIEERYGVTVNFGTGNIVYKETIADIVEGVGHFEPLRHYAEVHLILEPLPEGSGLVFDSVCSEDMLDKNWQRLILTHLAEKEHVGVLTGSPVTDMKITLAAGRAHLKHTEGGDFRQATYRAVRQGLMQAKSVLLEPYYNFRLEIPASMVGRAMTDIENMYGKFEMPEQDGENAVIIGSAPAAAMQNYPKEVIAYTRGHGRLFCDFKGYGPCHNTDEIIELYDYHPESDTENTPDSVFCAHGAGFNVNWRDVAGYMHLESALKKYLGKESVQDSVEDMKNYESSEIWIDTEEIDTIIQRTFFANQKDNDSRSKWSGRKRMTKEVSSPSVRVYRPSEPQEEYLLVDGYNIIYAWDELKVYVQDNLDGARGILMDILCNYQAIRQCRVMVVFDAYKVKGHVTSVSDYKNIQVVYTKEAETADQYIEKFAHENARKYRVVVATSDGLEQVIIRSKGCGLLSARELKEDIMRASEQNRQEYEQKAPAEKNRMFDALSEDTLKRVREAVENDDGK